jgi:hypothetical protein
MAVQSMWRGRGARARVRELRAAGDAADAEEMLEACVLMVQCNWRCHRGQVLFAALKAQVEAERDAERNREVADAGAMAIQSVWRGRAVRVRMQELESGFEVRMRDVCALVMQCWWRGLTASWCAMALASAMEGASAAAEAERELKRQVAAAAALQCRWRGRAARDRMHALESEFKSSMEHAATLTVQCWWRETMSRRSHAADNLWLRAEEARAEAQGAMAVQSMWRGRGARARVRELRAAGDAADAEEMLEACVLMVQCNWRCHRARGASAGARSVLAAVEEAKLQEASALTIQCCWRGSSARGKARELVQAGEDASAAEMLEACVLMVQCNWRCHRGQVLFAALKAQAEAECLLATDEEVMLGHEQFADMAVAGARIESEREHLAQKAADETEQVLFAQQKASAVGILLELQMQHNEMLTVVAGVAGEASLVEEQQIVDSVCVKVAARAEAAAKAVESEVLREVEAEVQAAVDAEAGVVGEHKLLSASSVVPLQGPSDLLADLFYPNPNAQKFASLSIGYQPDPTVPSLDILSSTPGSSSYPPAAEDMATIIRSAAALGKHEAEQHMIETAHQAKVELLQAKLRAKNQSIASARAATGHQSPDRKTCLRAPLNTPASPAGEGGWGADPFLDADAQIRSPENDVRGRSGWVKSQISMYENKSLARNVAKRMCERVEHGGPSRGADAMVDDLVAQSHLVQ